MKIANSQAIQLNATSPRRSSNSAIASGIE
jgi:hypothetical protein